LHKSYKIKADYVENHPIRFRYWRFKNKVLTAVWHFRFSRR